jgi:hypothetical protein
MKNSVRQKVRKIRQVSDVIKQKLIKKSIRQDVLKIRQEL